MSKGKETALGTRVCELLALYSWPTPGPLTHVCQAKAQAAGKHQRLLSRECREVSTALGLLRTLKLAPGRRVTTSSCLLLLALQNGHCWLPLGDIGRAN